MENHLSLSVIERYGIFVLKKEWNRIYSANPQVLPLQSYTYYKYLCYAFYLKHIVSRWRIVFHYVSDGINECIIPLVVHKRKRIIRGLSNFGRLDYEDIISSTNDCTFASDCIRAVLIRYEGYHIHLKNINESSILYRAFSHNMRLLEKCVTIDLPSVFDDYISSLSKHQRQNIRSAYNRIGKESFEICLEHYHKGRRIPRRLWSQCQRMYESRHGVVGGQFRIWFERQTNPYTHILHSDKGWRIFVLFHNNIPISYMAGLVSEDQRCYYVPRLCINNDYSRYSPGILLLVETIRQIISQDIIHLDLMLGDEPYKLAMGGRLHNNYEIDGSVNRLFE